MTGRSSRSSGLQTRISEGRDRLEAVRADPRRRSIALAVAVVVGLALARVHWLGLFVAGALVGLSSRTLPRAVAAGLAFGVAVLAVFAVGLGPAAPLALEMAPVVYVTVAAAFGLPLLGSLVRGVV